MRKIIASVLTLIHYFFFGLLLVVFHPIQWFALKFGGYTPHKTTVSLLNYLLCKIQWILGNRIEFRNIDRIPTGVPLIVVSNHQSLNDIPAFFWHLRKFHPKFVAKKELGKNIPSVSINLNHGGSVLIDRKDPKQAIPALIEFAKYIEANGYAAIIFPEGTRSRTGVLKKFSPNGLKMLMRYAPSSYIVPIAINNSWKLLKYGGFPMEIGLKISFDVLEPMKADYANFNAVFNSVEQQIKANVTV
jgi:1-acyl-sn-glycerol-3-phosphate acyltransferase